MSGRFLLVPVALVALTLLTGCPDDDTANDWDAERLDNQPSATPVAVKAFDMDGDNRLDIVSLWRGPAPATGTERTGAVAIHFQHPSGLWTTAVVDSGTRYGEANGLAIADINLDDDPDIVVAAMDRIAYLRAPINPRNEDNWDTFQLAASIRDDFKAWFDVAAAQIDNADGLDIVAALNDDGRLMWFQSPDDPDSADGWTLHEIDIARDEADSIALIDLDGDGRLDVVSSAPGEASGVLSWYRQPLNPILQQWPKHVMSNFAGATRFDLGDLDGDGDADLVAVSPDDRRLAWLPGPSPVTEKWNGWVLYDFTEGTTDLEPYDVAVADVDGNGQLDVVVAANSPASLWWFAPRDDIRLRWTPTRIVAVADVSFALMAVADVDDNGFPDVVVPVDHPDDDEQDRADFFINPTTQPG